MITNSDTNILYDIADNSVILHQVNCLGSVMQGLAGRIARQFPGWYDDYHKYCRWFSDGHQKELLGSFHRFEPKDKKIIICSAFGHIAPVKNVQTTDYGEWHSICRKIERQTRYVNEHYHKNWKIHIVDNIGTKDGLADPDEMMTIFNHYFKCSPVELVIHTY